MLCLANQGTLSGMRWGRVGKQLVVRRAVGRGGCVCEEEAAECESCIVDNNGWHAAVGCSVGGMYASMQVSSSGSGRGSGSGSGSGRAMEGVAVIRQAMHAHTYERTNERGERVNLTAAAGYCSARAERETLGLLVALVGSAKQSATIGIALPPPMPV